MKNIALYSFVCFTLIGCGGGGNSFSSDVSIIGDNFSIDLTKVSGYRANDSKEDRFLTVINYLRSLHIKCNDSEGREGPVGIDLEWNTLLNDAAQEHSDDMLATGIFSHDGSGKQTDITGQTSTPSKKSNPFERMNYHGYIYDNAGENISTRANTESFSDTVWVGAFEGLMKSSTGHCSNIMSPDFRDFAMAESLGMREVSFNGNVTRMANVGYWTQNFGTPR